MSASPQLAARAAVGRHLRLIGAQLRIAVLAALEYRVGFWTEGVVGLAWSLGGIVPLLVAFEHRPTVAGWAPWEIVLLTGFFLIVAGVFTSCVQPAVSKSMSQIRQGTLDYVLLRPADPLVSCLTAAFEPWSLLELVAGVVLVIVASLELSLSPGIAEFAQLGLVLLAGLSSLFALGVLLLAVSVRALRLQSLTYLLETLLDFAHWPISVFRGPFKLVFTFVLPFAVMTSYPAQSLLGTLAWPAVGQALLTALTLGCVARLAWQRALRGYTSASS